MKRGHRELIWTALLLVFLGSCAKEAQTVVAATPSAVPETYTKSEVDERIAAALPSCSHAKAAVVQHYSNAKIDADLLAVQAMVTNQLDAVGSEMQQTAQDLLQAKNYISTLESAVKALSAQVVATQVAVTTLSKMAGADPLGQIGPPVNMVQVGDIWVDKFEASFWARADGKPVDCAEVQQAVTDALEGSAAPADFYDGAESPACLESPTLPICAFKQYGSQPGCNKDVGCVDYPNWFPNSGEATQFLFACPIEGVMPSRNMTWFQSVVACSASGKHLTTNAEWQAAALGTVDPGAADGSLGECNTLGGALRATGLGTGCASAFGAQDMIGNLDEWVADWLPGGEPYMTGLNGGAKTPWGSCGDGQDYTANLNSTTFTNDGFKWKSGLPAAPFRGGHFTSGGAAGAYAINMQNGPTDWGNIHGARCARRIGGI